ncbi:AraC family transcriptional regulator [Halotalea alkalilenta]|uniref:AraC family transcriptional regulator n=1 Tax=Halotalea alkalilenta TaxID=376489 RepID=A0A172YGG9_9GAMM|nr:AraC family transcriptional regulator [Halotalea alkalilenta]ANF58206.1 AraC family transcriptional regulator [Halotalea alkalilenta]
MPDRLEALLAHFSVRAKTFHAGALCGVNDLRPEGDTGQLHLIRDGKVDVSHEGGRVALRITRPSLLLYPRPMAHRFITDPERGADFVCARLSFDAAPANPIAAALPAFICLPLDELDGVAGVLELLFDEAFKHNCGRQAVLDRLFEVILIQILRHLMERGETQVGMLAGLAHPRLRHALVAVHEQPAQPWSLDTLAARAGMSRSAFANSFREIIGCTPGLYLQRWRIGITQQLLRQGRPLKLIIHEVGYASEAALSRAFKASSGMSPRQWREMIERVA